MTQAKRQPGSTFKPFVYAAAIAAGKSPYSNYKDAQYVVESVRFVIVWYHQLPKRARWFGVCGAVRSYARTPRPLREPLTSTVHVLCVSVRSFAMRSYARKPIPQRMEDLKERKHASQSLPGESVLGMQSQRAQVHGMSML